MENRGWKDGAFFEIANITMGQSPNGDTCNNYEGIPLLNGPTEFGIKYPKEIQYTLDSKRECKPMDILFCVRGSTTGKMNWADKKYSIGRGLAAINHKNGHEYNNFVKGVLDYNLDLLLASATGSTFPNISRNQLENLQIKLPPLPEQKAIASVLSSLDDKIDLLHQQNQTLEALAETLYLNFIGDKEFNSKLIDVFSLQNGYAFKSKSFKESGTIRVIKIKNISGDIVDITNSDFVNDESIKKLDVKFKINSGDILIAMTGAEVGKLGIVPETDQSLWLNQRVGLLKEKFEGAKWLAYLHLKSDFGQDYIDNTATGSAQPNISGEGIENCEFPYFDDGELKNFCQNLSTLFDKVVFNLGQIQTLTKLRDTLLPKLMSGEMRVKTTDGYYGEN